MTLREMFGSAEWICAGPYEKYAPRTPDANQTPNFPILRARFCCGKIKKAALRVVGLGTFHAYINGHEITEDRFLPLSSDYEERPNRPINEKMHGHRLYVPDFDVTEYLREGDNVLVIWFGGGWYTFESEAYGYPKVIYRLTGETADGKTVEFVSSSVDRISDSPVKAYEFTEFESRDDRGFDFAAFGPDYDDSGWAHASTAAPLDTEYLFTDCPADRIAEVLPCTEIFREENRIVYDCGYNIAGIPVLHVTAGSGETVTVRFSEERLPDGQLHPGYHYNQHYTYVSDGTEKTVRPAFMWYGFRYLEVTGQARPEGVEVIHADVAVNARFSCDSPAVNWLYDAFLRTQLNNMHGGIPSDCPHIERRGYTGDGELICHAAMDVLDAQAFYRKWIDDISDCQDVYTGHVQYTAPYLHSGGGPGAWGCAIVEVPYRYWIHYGDLEPAKRLYPQMLRYFDYLDSHSENGLIISDKQGDWCLGDWCAPDPVLLPAPFVNGYYYVISLRKASELAPLIGRACDVPSFNAKIERLKRVLTHAYFNTWDGNFFGCLQGGNAFAVDIGIGDARTYRNLVNYYTRLGHYDTGICGTDVVTRVLFEHGNGELAVRLLTSEHTYSFESMRRAGATTLWENWPNSVWERSHDHPMFGAVTAYLFDYLLGIRQKEQTVGYAHVIVSPTVIPALGHVTGSRIIGNTEYQVEWLCPDGDADAGRKVVITVTLSDKPASPDTAEFVWKGQSYDLKAGVNRFEVDR